MREFNFLGLSIISSARGPSSFLARPPSFTLRPGLISRLPGRLSLRYPRERRTIFPTAPSTLPLSDHILKNPTPGRHPLISSPLLSPTPLLHYPPRASYDL